ncbi:MAG: LamG-like jellyroll fold domain-containing protein, partial [archaeon]
MKNKNYVLFICLFISIFLITLFIFNLTSSDSSRKLFSINGYSIIEQSTIFQPGNEGKDAYVESSSPTRNYGADTTINIRATDAARSLIEFNLSEIDSASIITNATLRLYLSSKGTGASIPVIIQTINNSWVEGTGIDQNTNDGVTWNNRSGNQIWNSSGVDFNSYIWANTTVSSEGVFYTWDITPLVQGWINGTYENNGILIRAGAGDGIWKFASSDSTNATIRPKLNITYTESILPVINSINIPSNIREGEEISLTINTTDNTQVSNVLIEINGTNYSLSPSAQTSSQVITIIPVLEGTIETNQVINYPNVYDKNNDTYAGINNVNPLLLVKTPGVSTIGAINSVKIKIIHSKLIYSTTGDVHWAASSEVQGLTHGFNSANSSLIMTEFDITSEKNWTFSDFNLLTEIHINNSGNTLRIYETWFEVNYTPLSSPSLWNATINISNLSSQVYNYTIFSNDTFGNIKTSIGNFTILPELILMNISMNDAEGSFKPSEVIIYNKNRELEMNSSMAESQLISLESGEKDIIITPVNSSVKTIEFENATINESVNGIIDIDDSPEKEDFTRIYALNPHLNSTNATVTAEAVGNELYKCKDWNFTEQTCYGDWIKVNITLIPGEEYNFTLTAEDPGFAEIIVIIKAEHLNSSRYFISDIYEEVKTFDDIWSETIPNGDYVRVTFEKNLTNEKDITLYPRIISGTPIIEVYEINESILIAEFNPVNSNRYNKIYLTNLLGEQDTFDLKIVGGSIEFDHIFDPSYNWIKDLSINASLPSVGANARSAPTVFYKDESWFLISGATAGTFFANSLAANGTWLKNLTINASLSDVGALSKPTVFYKNNSWYMIAGNNTGRYNGFVLADNGTTWLKNSTINASLPDTGTFAAPEVFYKDGVWTMISGDTSGLFRGYTYDDASLAWVKSLAVNASLSDAGGNSTATVFQKDGTWYLISGNLLGTFQGFNWTGSAWQTDFDINASLPDIGANSAPEVFQKDGTWYLISGATTGTFYGYNYSIENINPTYSSVSTNNTYAGEITNFTCNVPDESALQLNGQWIFSTNNTGAWVNDSAVNFTAISQWANVTKTLNSTEGTFVGYRWYLTDNAGNINNTGIYTLTTKGINLKIINPNTANPLSVASGNNISIYFNYSVNNYDSPAMDNYLSVGSNLTYLQYSGWNQALGQSFTGDGGTLNSATFQMNKTGSPIGNLVFKIYGHSGVFGTSSISNGTVLATSESINVSTLNAALMDVTLSFIGANKIVLTNGTNYVLTSEYSGGDSSNYLSVTEYYSSPLHGGNLMWADNGVDFTPQSSQDFYFSVNKDSSYTNLTSEVTINNVTIGGSYANILASLGVSSSAFEGFESVSFPPTGWQTGGNATALFVRDQTAGGTVNGSADAVGYFSGSSDLSRTWLNYTYNFPSNGWISFYWNVSCESEFDFGCFCVDKECGATGCRCVDSSGAGNPANGAGEADRHITSISDGAWTNESINYSITAGSHSFTWCYSKDAGGGLGSDALIVDNITFVASSSSSTQFAYIPNIGWQANVTVPTFESGLKDLFVNATYSGAVRNDIQTNAINYGGADSTPPTYSLNSTNNTIIGEITNFSIYVDDNLALSPNGTYIFSTNNTGSWINESAVNFTAKPSWANVTKTLNSTEGTSIGYRWYLTDNAGNINNTGIYTLTTTPSTDIISPAITFESPTPDNDSTVNSSTQTIVANISDASNISSWIDLDRDLLGYWAMDYYNATGIYDNSSYNQFGTFVDGLNYSNLTTGIRGQGLNFDGSDDYINTSNFANNLSNFTVSAWFKSTSSFTNLGGNIISKLGSGGLNSGTGWVLGVSGPINVLGENHVTALVQKDGSNYIIKYSTATNFIDGSWHNAVMIVTNLSFVKLYVDGVEQTGTDSLGSLTGGFSNSQPVMIGNDFDSELFNGSIDEVLIFNRSLSSTEVLALYNSTNNKFNATFTNLAEGEHNYTIYAIDANGNSNNSGLRNFTYSSSDIISPTYSLNSTNSTIVGIATNFSIYVNDNVALNPNGTYIFSTNNTGSWINDSVTSGFWQENLLINSSLPDTGATSEPEIFYMNGIWNLISDDTSGNRMPSFSYNQSSLSWLPNSSLNVSGYSAYYSKPAVFQKDGVWNMIIGKQAGRFDGYSWVGEGWQINLTLNESLPDLGSYSAPTIFYKDESWYLIAGNVTGLFSGFVLNSNGSWMTNSTITTSLPSVGTYSIPSVFQKDGTWYLISGNLLGTFQGFNWTGSAWQDDFNINASLPDVGANSAPTIFYKNESWYLISGAGDGRYYGYNYFSSLNFTATPSWANVTKTLNSTVGTFVGYRWYLTDNAGNINNTGIYTLTTTPSTDTTPPTITFESSTPDNDSTVNSSTQTIVANISDASNTSSWIDFDKSILGYWAMDYYNATGIYDNSSYNQFGTFVGGLNYSNLTTGVRGQGLNFDGVNDGANQGISATPFNITSQFALSTWVKPGTISGTNVRSILTQIYVFEINVDPTTDKFSCGIGSGIDWYGGINSQSLYSTDEWAHIVCSFNNTHLLLYVNGVLENITATTDIIGQNIYSFQIGRSYNEGYSFNGTIDEVFMFNKSLSQTEVSALYNSQSNKFNATITNLIEGKHNYVVYAIDADGNVNNSRQSFFVNDTLIPTYSQISVNNTIMNKITKFSIYVEDNVALNPNGTYIFSTNNTGSWINESVVNFTTTPSWANVTKTLNSTEGTFIGYRWYFKDNAGNINNTEIYTLTTTGADTTPPIITFESPTPDNDSTVNSSTQTIVANISDASNTSSWIDFDKSVLGYWAMDYYNATGIYDNSSYSRFATFVSTLNYSTANSTGARGKALTFDGDIDALTIPSFNLGSNFTAAAWVKPNAMSSPDRVIVGKYLSFVMEKNDINNSFICVMGDGTDWIDGLYSSTAYTPGQWYHVACLYKNGNLTIYVNGVAENSILIDPPGANSQIFRIGHAENTAYTWNGSIDEVIIFNRSLSSKEMLALYNSQSNKFNSTFENLALGQHNYTVYAIDAPGNVNNSGLRNFTYASSDSTPPTYSLNSTNNTIVGIATNFSIYVNDDVALHPNGTYIFSTNNTGTWVNESAVNFTATPSWANVTKTLNSTEGTFVGYRWYLTDNAGNINNTGIYTLTTTAFDTIPPTITFESPTPDNDSTVNSSTQTIVANISDASNTSSFIDFDKSLIDYLAMDYYNSTGIYDNSTYNNFGTFVNGASTSDIATGIRGKTFNFDGSDSGIKLPHFNLNDSFTVSAWINPSVMTSSTKIIMSKLASFEMGKYTGNNSLFCVIGDGSSWRSPAAVSSTSIVTGQWLHLTCSYNGTALTIYIDGVAEHTAPVAAPGDNSYSFYIGRSQTNGYSWNGSVDEVLVFNRGLSASEVSALYDSQSNKFNTTFTNLAAGQHNYTVYAIDANGNSNNSGERNFTYFSSDITPPTYSLNSTNNTIIGEITNFSIYVNDDIALSPNGTYIFSTNNTGSWINESVVNFTAKPSWANVTKTLNSTEGTFVGYRWYLTDNAGNINNTGIYTLTTTPSTDTTPPIITFESPTSDNDSTVNSPNQTIVANISDASNTSSFIDFDKSILGYWAMDYYNATGIYDNSSYGNNASFVTGTGLNYSNLTAGARGEGLTFDGNNDYLNAGNSSSTNLLTNYTISAWIYPIGWGGGYGRIVDRGDASTIGYTLFITSGYDSKTNALVTMHYGATSNTASSNNNVISLSTWQHIVAIYNASGVTYYVNGIFAGYDTSITAPVTAPSNPLYIGMRSDSNRYFNGTIDELMIFNRSISSTEVLALYNSQSNKFNSTFTNLSNGQHNYTVYAIDASGNANNSGLRNFTYSSSDITPPTYSLNSTNSTIIGEITNFSIYVNDDVALSPNGTYIFSTNNTGSWVNDSAVNFTATPSWANVTKTLNSTVGTFVGYRWYLTDNAGNINNT